MPDDDEDVTPVSAEAGKSDPEKTVEPSSGVPRPLKIAVLVIPLVATFCAGVWTVLTQYAELQKSLEKERTQQERIKKEGEDQRVAAEKVKLDQEKETTTQQQLRQEFERASKVQEFQFRETLEQLKNHGLELQASQSQAEQEIQNLKTVEQQSRERVSGQEIRQKDAEIKRTEETEKAENQSRDDQAVASAISSAMAMGEKVESDAALALLLRYVNEERYRDEIAAALATKSARLQTIEQAQLWLRVARAIVPSNSYFELLTNANRTARQRVARGAVAQFWALYADHAKEMPPDGFLAEMTGKQPFISDGSPARREIESEIDKYFPRGTRVSADTVAKQMPSILGQFSSDALPAQIYTLVMEQTGELIIGYIEGSSPKLAPLDISGCYLPRHPIPGASVRLISGDLYVRP